MTRDAVRFQAVFPTPQAGVEAMLDAAAIRAGYVRAPRGRALAYAVTTDARGTVDVALDVQPGWSGLQATVVAWVVHRHGWPKIEELLVAWCESLEVVIGRSTDADGFPRIEPWELAGGLDAFDAVQWLGSAVCALHGIREGTLDGATRFSSSGGLWLRLGDGPLEDPATTPAVESNLFRLNLWGRTRPTAVQAAADAARRQRAARAARRSGDPEASLALLARKMAGPDPRPLATLVARALRRNTTPPPHPGTSALASLLARAAGVGRRSRVAHHLASCVERYGMGALADSLPVLATCSASVLRAEPEDAVELVVRAMAWRDESRPLVEAQVVLERVLELAAEHGPRSLALVLEADDPEVVRGLLALELIAVRTCSCAGCAARRERLGPG